MAQQLKVEVKGQRPYKLFWHGEASMLHQYIQRGACVELDRGRARWEKRATGHGPQQG